MIVSDKDPIFTSLFWQELFKLKGTKLAMGSSYHPQFDRQSEVVNKGVEHNIRSFLGISRRIGVDGYTLLSGVTIPQCISPQNCLILRLLVVNQCQGSSIMY